MILIIFIVGVKKTAMTRLYYDDKMTILTNNSIIFAIRETQSIIEFYNKRDISRVQRNLLLHCTYHFPWKI